MISVLHLENKLYDKTSEKSHSILACQWRKTSIVIECSQHLRLFVPHVFDMANGTCLEKLSNLNAVQYLQVYHTLMLNASRSQELARKKSSGTE